MSALSVKKLARMDVKMKTHAIFAISHPVKSALNLIMELVKNV